MRYGLFGMIRMFRNTCWVEMRISARAQITIPKHLRERFGMHQNVQVEVVPTDRGLLIRKRVGGQHPVDRVYRTLGKGALGENLSVDDQIEEIRGR